MHRLYDRYAGLASAIALRYAGRGDGMRDIVQEAFLKVFSQIGRFEYRGEGSLRGWVSSVVTHAAIDYVRAAERFRHTDGNPVEADTDDPDIGGISDETLFSMIADLPDGCRTVLNLYVFEQKSHKEIAQLLGISHNTSASQFHHAKHLLAQMIMKYRKEETL